MSGPWFLLPAIGSTRRWLRWCSWWGLRCLGLAVDADDWGSRGAPLVGVEGFHPSTPPGENPWTPSPRTPAFAEVCSSHRLTGYRQTGHHPQENQVPPWRTRIPGRSAARRLELDCPGSEPEVGGIGEPSGGERCRLVSLNRICLAVLRGNFGSWQGARGKNTRSI